MIFFKIYRNLTLLYYAFIFILKLRNNPQAISEKSRNKNVSAGPVVGKALLSLATPSRVLEFSKSTSFQPNTLLFSVSVLLPSIVKVSPS